MVLNSHPSAVYEVQRGSARCCEAHPCRWTAYGAEARRYAVWMEHMPGSFPEEENVAFTVQRITDGS